MATAGGAGSDRPLGGSCNSHPAQCALGWQRRSGRPTQVSQAVLGAARCALQAEQRLSGQLAPGEFGGARSGGREAPQPQERH